MTENSQLVAERLLENTLALWAEYRGKLEAVEGWIKQLRARGADKSPGARRRNIIGMLEVGRLATQRSLLTIEDNIEFLREVVEKQHHEDGADE